MVVKSLDYKKDTNFWEQNPNFLAIPAFKELYDKDKSKKKSSSSDIMWGIVLLYHPDSTFSNLPLKNREEIVSSFIGVSEISKRYKKEIKEFENLILSPAKRQLAQWNRIMNEKTEFMEKTPYDENNWEMLEEMMRSNVSLYKEFERINDALNKEGNDGEVRGGGTESASESGII